LNSGKDKTVPDSWAKFKDITLYWIDKGVDGFRFDMAEMVPVEFWSYLNSAIKMKILMLSFWQKFTNLILQGLY
jgi:glycosidase